jgi:hypothetical protein
MAAGGMNMQARERNLVKWVAKLSLWLAPIPSGYFVAQASRAHLTIPVPIAIIIGFIIEFLGIASVHTWLWLMNWNATKRKRDPQTPANLAILMGSTYIVTTIGLTVVLEIFPQFSSFAPAIFFDPGCGGRGQSGLDCPTGGARASCPAGKGRTENFSSFE